MNKPRFSPVTFALLCLLPTTVRADKVDDYIKMEMHRRRIPGASVAILRDGKMVRAQGYGFANLELPVSATENTVYPIASMTKQITATAIMMLVEEGKIRLDDRIADHLPNLPSAWSAITIRQALNHTSGIKDFTDSAESSRIRSLDSTPGELIALVAKESLQFTPGTVWRYSNTNYVLLGMLIEQISGKKYGDFLNDRILKPLGMIHTRVNDLQSVIPNRAQGYTRVPGSFQNGAYTSPSYTFGAGSLISTVRDLAKWDAALYTQKLLNKASMETMWKPTTLSNGQTADYGFGWGIGTVNGHRLISHGGNVSSGFSCGIVRFVDDRLTVIVLTNFFYVNGETFARNIACQILPELAVNGETPVVDTDPQRTLQLKRAFVGMLNGEMDPELFSEKLKQDLGVLIGRHKEEARARYAENGRFEKFELMEQKVTDQGIYLRYRAVFEHGSMMIYISRDNAGKITNWGITGAE